MLKVEGKNKKGDVKLFALSTCVWCSKTRNLLDENKIEYEYIYLDQLHGSERETALKDMHRLSSGESFPTIYINGEVIVGFKEEEIKRALNL
ncbi:MAG: glutaredoxin family protein [Actinobacteria bacterium]|nr:glutaredoxin family protein [Actinomycetota bacterium]